jgi:hypothetical protein
VMTFEEFVTRQEENDLADVPKRVRLMILGGMVDWEPTLRMWYEHLYGKGEKPKEEAMLNGRLRRPFFDSAPPVLSVAGAALEDINAHLHAAIVRGLRGTDYDTLVKVLEIVDPERAKREFNA